MKLNTANAVSDGKVSFTTMVVNPVVAEYVADTIVNEVVPASIISHAAAVPDTT